MKNYRNLGSVQKRNFNRPVGGTTLESCGEAGHPDISAHKFVFVHNKAAGTLVTGTYETYEKSPAPPSTNSFIGKSKVLAEPKKYIRDDDKIY